MEYTAKLKKLMAVTNEAIGNLTTDDWDALADISERLARGEVLTAEDKKAIDIIYSKQ